MTMIYDKNYVYERILKFNIKIMLHWTELLIVLGDEDLDL